MFKVRHKGNFNNFERFCNRALKKDYLNILADYGERGVAALREATPIDDGELANAWNYYIEDGNQNGMVRLVFTNSLQSEGISVAILVIYGHALRNGGYVEGNDFVTPALKPIFNELADAVWKGVTE